MYIGGTLDGEMLQSSAKAEKNDTHCQPVQTFSTNIKREGARGSTVQKRSSRRQVITILMVWHLSYSCHIHTYQSGYEGWYVVQRQVIVQHSTTLLSSLQACVHM